MTDMEWMCFIGAAFCVLVVIALWLVRRKALREGFNEGFNKGYEAALDDSVSPSPSPSEAAALYAFCKTCEQPIYSWDNKNWTHQRQATDKAHKAKPKKGGKKE